MLCKTFLLKGSNPRLKWELCGEIFHRLVEFMIRMSSLDLAIENLIRSLNTKRRDGIQETVVQKLIC